MFRDCLLYVGPGLKMGHQDWSPDLQKFTGQAVKHNTCVWRSPHSPRPAKRSVSWVVHGQFHWTFSKEDHAKVHGQDNFWHQTSRRGRLPNTGNKLGWEVKQRAQSTQGCRSGARTANSAVCLHRSLLHHQTRAPTRSQSRVYICWGN